MRGKSESGDGFLGLSSARWATIATGTIQGGNNLVAGLPLRLVADIGGTHARFALCERHSRPSEPVVYRCADYPDISTALGEFLDRSSDGRSLVDGYLAVAAPITGDRIALTNHPWQFEIADLRRSLGFGRLHIVNDFTAIALSLPHLQDADVRQIGDGVAAPETARAVIGPGTGLGVSGLVSGGGHIIALTGEGGHVDFAPVDALEREIFRWLSVRFDHVSLERVLSGPGLVNLFCAICHVEGMSEVLQEVGDLDNISAADVVRRAESGNCPASARAVVTFCAILGSAAGNLALTVGARGGVYIAGGVVLKLGDAFAPALFRDRFVAKGRFRTYLEVIPTFIITEPNPALLGLAYLSADAT